MADAAKLKHVHDELKKKFKDKKLVFGSGSLSASVVLVGETATPDGKIIDAKHEKLILKLLKSAGIDKKQVYITAAIKYSPARGSTVSPKEVKSHSTFLKEEIHSLDPKVVVTLGNIALNGVGMRQPLENVHGRTFLLGAFDLLPTYHPEHAIKDPGIFSVLEADFIKLKSLIAERKENPKTA